MPSDDIEPFHLEVHGDDLADLRARLLAARWPDPPTDPTQGIALDRLQSLCTYWAEAHDWRLTEEWLNTVGQFRTAIDGLGIQFVHARSSDPHALPLLLTHGWPGSIIEFREVIGPLNDAGFHCVVPSLPGYGWSDKPTVTGWGVERIARAWATLMARLGYDRYGAQGSDWGTSVSASLGQLVPEHVVGIHLVPPLVPADPATLGELTKAEQQALNALADGAENESGYSAMQRTRPQTVGYALTDSPVGLAAWIGEKLISWTDPRCQLSDDAILDSLMFYWLPRTAASSARLYWESLRDVARWLEGPLQQRDHVDTPAGCTVFPFELQRPSRRWAERRFHDIRYWNEPERGGHFPAVEVPELFVDEVTRFFALVR